MKILDKLEELEAVATPAPWKYDCGNNEIEHEESRFGICCFSNWSEALSDYKNWTGGRPEFPHFHRDNAEYIAAIRNAAPALLRVARAAESLFNPGDSPDREAWNKGILRKALDELESV